MHWTIARKLFLALLLSSLAILATNAVLTQLSFERGFLAYLSAQEAPALHRLAKALENHYADERDWSTLRSDPHLWHQMLQASGPSEPGRRFEGGPLPHPGPERPGRPPPPAGPLGIGGRLGLFDPDGRQFAGLPHTEAPTMSVPVEFDGRTVAVLSIEPAVGLTENIDIQFARGQTRSLVITTLVLLALSLLFAFTISRRLTRPIKALAAGARAMSSGDYDDRIVVDSHDELGSLAKDYNRLAETLARNRIARRQWSADISHELRTPLAILTGELHALEDGVRKFGDPVRESLQIEVNRLTQLVGDLDDLSDSDEGALGYRRVEFDVAELLRDVTNAAAARISDAGLRMRVALPDSPVYLFADPTRIEQLFINLVGNSIRYTEASGQLDVRCDIVDNHVKFTFDDSAPGVPPEALSRLFNRLFRVESSRSRRTGGSGLGLSICKRIVTASDGQIDAANSPIGGLRIVVTLPLTGPARDA